MPDTPLQRIPTEQLVPVDCLQCNQGLLKVELHVEGHPELVQDYGCTTTGCTNTLATQKTWALPAEAIAAGLGVERTPVVQFPSAPTERKLGEELDAQTLGAVVTRAIERAARVVSTKPTDAALDKMVREYVLREGGVPHKKAIVNGIGKWQTRLWKRVNILLESGRLVLDTKRQLLVVATNWTG
jgi:hypothetical protein